jgi:hypothetical protein
MTPRPLTDAQLAAALRAHLPVAHAGLHEQIRAAISTTPQQRRLFSILGRLTDADPVARRRVVLIAALVALAFAASIAAIAGALLREKQAPDLSLDPPTDLPAFVRSTYDDMPKLQPMTITAVRDGTTKIRIFVDVSGATRIEEFASINATEPASYKIFAGSTMAELTDIGTRRASGTSRQGRFPRIRASLSSHRWGPPEPRPRLAARQSFRPARSTRVRLVAAGDMWRSSTSPAGRPTTSSAATTCGSMSRRG